MKDSLKKSPDALLKGILTKVGETFDKITGRNWKPSSALATSELIARLKLLIDAEARRDQLNRIYAPHNIKLKMQWDKFSADSEVSIGMLEKELHVAAIDHINDKRFYTYAPFNIEITPDYFTDGVKLLASFQQFGASEGEAEINVTLPALNVSDLIPQIVEEIEISCIEFELGYVLGDKRYSINLGFKIGDRKSVGRTNENDVEIDDISVSKIHAAFVLNSLDKLVLADTGSTNGTFINGRRIAYGRAFEVGDGETIKFGNVEVNLSKILSVEAEPLPNDQNETNTELSSEVSDDKESENNTNSEISDLFETNAAGQNWDESFELRSPNPKQDSDEDA